jgi:prepilin-type processing-associated H-X9-DG protein
MREEENKNQSRPDYASRPNAFRSQPEHHPLTLSYEDAAAIDAILENGGSKQYAQQDLDERTMRAAAWLETLGTHRVNQPPMDLAARTLAVVADERMKFEPAEEKREEAAAARGGIFSRRFAEFAAMAIAATVLLVVLIPGIGQARQTAMRAECASNQGSLGRAFASYAAAHSDALPSLASPMGASWQPMEPAAASPVNHSNTANILPLVREKFVSATEVARLTCPAVAPTTPVNWNAEMNDLPEGMRGYNLVNMYGPQKPTWDKKAGTIILADANPIFKAGCKSISENSPNHGGKGSMVLYADGSARWQQSAEIGPNHDNIWTVAEKPTLVGYTYTEAPQSVLDVFLSP